MQKEPPGFLYNETPNYRDFKEAITARVNGQREVHIGVTDIADFYARIYRHRLVNALQAANPRLHDYVRVLEKLLSHFSENDSYGIPIGPPASRPLGEALLIDVDSTLLSYGIDFVRFTDDYIMFATTPTDVEYGIRVLGETLFLNHGLTLQAAKTTILKGTEYVERYLTAHSNKEEARRRLLEIVGDYGDTLSYSEMDEEKQREIDALNLSEMLSEALAEGQSVDYREVSFILGRLSALEKPELIPIVLDNLERLSPVAHSIAAFFTHFTELEPATQTDVATALLAPILDDSKYASEYYSIWILSIFAASPSWNHAASILRIFREAATDTVRRYAALALSTCGNRAEVIQVKRYLQAASSLTRTAMMLAMARMGTDEQRYLRQSLTFDNSLERLCMT